MGGPDQRAARQLWSTAKEPQLTVIVRQVGSAEDARAVVDWAAPVDATQPSGWDGGRHGGGDVPGRIGAAYAASKAVAREVITTLAL